MPPRLTVIHGNMSSSMISVHMKGLTVMPPHETRTIIFLNCWPKRMPNAFPLSVTDLAPDTAGVMRLTRTGVNQKGQRPLLDIKHYYMDGVWWGLHRGDFLLLLLLLRLLLLPPNHPPMGKGMKRWASSFTSSRSLKPEATNERCSFNETYTSWSGGRSTQMFTYVNLYKSM